jgi:2,3-bisphosphoglycerate-independent phosphoglycerate mutase
MRRVTIVVPGLVGGPEEESGLRPLPEALQRIVEGSAVSRLSPLPPSATPEAAYLALDPTSVHVAQGPLTVAALGHLPPDGSVHFHLSLCSVDASGVLRSVDDAVPAENELDAVFAAVERLRTSSLTPLRGEMTDHALVWESGSLDMSTTPIAEALGDDAYARLPKGEGEPMMRRFIDDSINLLSALEVNHMRSEEGQPLLNCLWPWGQGFRPALPNLPLRRGDVAHVVSGSMRLAGLCRMVGYAHGDRAAFGRGLQTNYDLVRDNALSHRLSLAVVGSVQEMRRHGRIDEIAWNVERLSQTVIEPLLGQQEPWELRIASPGDEAGLALTYKSQSPAENALPFDERVLDDPRSPILPLWELLQGAYRGDIQA